VTSFRGNEIRTHTSDTFPWYSELVKIYQNLEQEKNVS